MIKTIIESRLHDIRTRADLHCAGRCTITFYRFPTAGTKRAEEIRCIREKNEALSRKSSRNSGIVETRRRWQVYRTETETGIG